MKKVRVNKGTVGLIIRKKAYKRVVTEGAFWLMPGEDVVMCNMAKPFVPPFELNIMLEDEALAALLIVVKVMDNEIVLQYEDGIFKGVLTPGKYTFWKGVIDYSFTTINLGEKEIPADFDLNLLQKPGLACLHIHITPRSRLRSDPPASTPCNGSEGIYQSFCNGLVHSC